MTRAALYIRVSSTEQAKEGDSIPAQRKALREYAASHHLRIYREYVDDGISGTKYSQTYRRFNTVKRRIAPESAV